MSDVPQQADLRRRVESRGLEVVGIGTGDGDTDAIACVEQVRGRQEVKHQFDRLSGRNRCQVALVMAVVGQAQVVVGSFAQSAVRRPQVPLGEVGRRLPSTSSR